MGEGTTTWEDVLSGPDESEAAAPNDATKPTKRGKLVGWNDLLDQPSAPVTLNVRRGGFSGVMPPAPESSGISPLLSHILPQFLRPSERTGTHYEAAPNQPTPEERLGEMVPESAIPTLGFLNRYAVQPFERVAQAGAKAGGEILEGTAARVLQPIAAPELAAQPTAPMEEMEKRFPTTLGASKGIGEVVGGAAVDPRNWPFFGSSAARPILQRLISVGFTGLMGKGAVDAAHELHDNWDKLTPTQRAEIGTQSGLSAALAALTATHAVGSEASTRENAPRSETYPPPRQGETGEPSANVPPQPQPTAGMPSGRDTTWEDVLRRPAQAASERTASAEPKVAGTHPADEVAGIDEATGLPIALGQQAAPEMSISVENNAKNNARTWESLLGQSVPQEAATNRASISTARKPVVLRNQQEMPGEYGGQAVVKTPTSDLPAKYKLVEAQDLTPSHNAETFAPNPNYPPGVQERSYHTSKEAQARVIQQEQNYDPRYTINTNPDAVNGPPIVTPDGTVLGGNSRTMSTQRLYSRGQGDSYRDYLRQNAQQFGINPDAIDRLKAPVLVREIPAPSDVEAARRLGSELNKNMTGALGTSERAVSAGKSITPQSLSAISGMLDDLGAESSIRDLLRERGRDVLSLLTKDGAVTDRERPQFIDTATGGLSEEGKQFAERALLGTVVDDPTLMERTPKSILNKLDGSLADISSITPRTDEYNILPLVREAIAEHADIASRGLNVESHLAQAGMFAPERNPAVDAIVRKLAEKPKAVREAFRSFAKDANADEQGQGFLAMSEQPSASVAFNEAFGTKLTDTEFTQGVLQSLKRETQKGSEYGQTTQQEASLPIDESLRQHPTEGATRRTETGMGPDRQRTSRQQREQQHSSLYAEPDDSVSGSLFAHTPFSVAHLALNRLNKFYHEKIAEPLIQEVIKTGRTHPEVEKADPEFADNLRLLDNAPKYFRQKAQAIIRNVTAGLDRNQERLFTLMADVDSRENLRTNHPDEYRKAQSDPAIQSALKKYRPEEQKLTEARRALGGETIDDDYLRRVYDKYTNGINKRETAGKGLTAYDRVIRPQRADRFSREAESEYHYRRGLHEFGPAFGTKYVATMIKVARNRAALDFLSKATPIENGEYLPRQIEHNGKTYYGSETARDMREGGKRNVETYGTYSPQANGDRYLGPRSVIDALNGLDAPGAKDPSAIKRFFQEQTVGLGFGVPHMFNIMRRVTQSAPGGAINPVGWARALKVAFSRELKARGISGVDDPTFDRLAKFGAIASDSEVSSFKKYIGGNLNPANWIRPFSKLGHDILFKPGALDQRARLYIADLIKSQRPELSDSRIAQAVNEQLGNYNRANWTNVQTKIARFVLFPGWDMSSLNWVIRHPIKTSVPPALLIWTANQAINAMGGNRESEKNDFFTVHADNRGFSTGLINEPLGKAVGGASLRFGQALVEGKSTRRAIGEASRGLATDVTRPLGMLRPDLGAAIELGTNRERIGGSKEIFKSSDFSTPGRVLPNAGLEKIAMHVLSRMLPQAGRVTQATENSGKTDLAQFAGGNLGVYNYPVTAESRLRKKMAIASDYSQSKSAVLKQNPQAVKDLFTGDPDAAVYLAFRPHMQQTLGQLKKIDQAKEMISSSSEAPERKKAAIAALGRARDQEVANADKVDRAVDMVLKRVHEQRGTGLPNLPIFRMLRRQMENQPTTP